MSNTVVNHLRTGLTAGLTGCAALLLVTFTPPPGGAAAQSLAQGRELFQLCAQCHGDAGEGDPAPGVAAPAIAGLPAWYLTRQLENFKSGARGRHFDDLEGLRMRPMALSLNHAGDIEAVAAYTAALPVRLPEPSVEGDATAGGQLYPLCASCHGVHGEGSEPQGGPPLHIQGDWYLRAQLVKYKEGVRGVHPQDTWGLMMRPMALVLTSEKSLDDMIAYIMTLPGEPAAAPAK